MASKNLLLNTDFTRGQNSWTNWGTPSSRAVIDDTEVTGFTKALQVGITGSNQGAFQSVSLPAGTYTFSAWVKSTVAGTDYIQYWNGSTWTSVGNVPTTWTRMSSTFTLATQSNVTFYLGRGAGSSTATTFTTTGIQLESGNTVTAWVPGTEPNLLQNTGFLNGTTSWNINIPTSQTMTGKIIDEDAAPSSKALHITASSAGAGYWQPSTLVTGLTIGHTYTLSVIAKGAASGIYWGWEGLVQHTNLTDNYQHIAYTFTYSSVHNFVFYTNNPGDLYIQSAKLEEGSYSTDWVPSQLDINSGIDRPVIAKAQYTVVDWNEKVGLVASIASNQVNTQQYSPATEQFSPDWAVTHLVLTASLFKNGGSDTNVINDGNVKTIKWYKLSVLDGTTPVLISNDGNYSVNGNTLTVTQNVLTTLDSIDYICEITYTDPVSGSDMLAKASTMFSRVQNAGPLTFALATLPNGNNLQNGQAQAYQNNTTYIGRNLLRGTQNFSSPYFNSNNPANAATDSTMKFMNLTPSKQMNAAWMYLYQTFNFVLGKTYTLSAWVRTNKVGMSVGAYFFNGSFAEGYFTFDSTNVNTWVRWKWTVTVDGSTEFPAGTHSVRLETGTANSTDWLWVAGLKLEEGSTATDWSMAPEDITTIDQAIGNKNWRVRKYTSIRTDLYPPIYSDILNQPVVTENTMADAKDLFTETSDFEGLPAYINDAQTAVYVNQDTTLPLTLTNNGPLTAYVNENMVYQETVNLLQDSNVTISGTNQTTQVSQTFTNVLTAADIKGKYITLSVDIDVTNGTQSGMSGRVGAEFNVQWTDGTISYYGIWESGFSDATPKTTKKRISATFSPYTGTKTIQSISSVGIYIQCGGIAYVSNPKMEFGQVSPTTWTQSPLDRNLLVGGATEHTNMPTEYIGIPILDIAKAYMGQNITISFDLKSTLGGSISCYSLGRYTVGFSTPVTTTTSYQRFTLTGKFAYGAAVDPNGENCNLSFYGTYGTGNFPSVKNVRIEVGTKTGIRPFLLSPEETTKTLSLPLKQGWNTLDFLWLHNNKSKIGLWGMTAGGTNLLLNTTTSTSGGRVHYNGYADLITSRTNVSRDSNGYQRYEIAAGTSESYARYSNPNLTNLYGLPVGTYTFSGELYVPVNGGSIPNIRSQWSDGTTWYDTNGNGSVTPTITKGVWTPFSRTITIPSNGAGWYISFQPVNTELVTGNYYLTRNLKFEAGSVATPWTPAPSENVNSNALSIATNGLNAFYSVPFEKQLTSGLIAKCNLYRGSVMDTTNVAYQWYKQDPTVVADQGGGVGWLKLTGASVETGYTTDTLIIPPNAIKTVNYYKCIIQDTQVDSITFNGYFNSVIAVSNVVMPINVEVVTNGTILLYGQGSKTLTAKLTQMGREIDAAGTQYTYKWYRYLQDGTVDATWNSNQGFKTGKTLVITDPDVSLKATFSVEVN